MLHIERFAPGPRLRGAVRDCAQFSERAAPLEGRREVPFAGAVLIISLGPRMLINGEWLGSFTGGLTDRPVVTGHAGEQAGLQLDLSPLGARALLGVPMDELRDRSVALEDVLPAAAELTERVAEAPDWRARRAVLDEILGARLAEAPPPRPEVAHAYRRLVGGGGRTRVEDLAAEVGWSRRHLAATFRREIGMTPKAFARLVRFERAVRLLRAGRSPADAAFTCGYADQPHFNRDFRAITGAAPGEFPFVQDERAAA